MSYRDFNNAHFVPSDSTNALLAEEVPTPILDRDWEKGEALEDAKSRRLSTKWRNSMHESVVETTAKTKKFWKRGNNAQRITFGVFGICMALALVLYFVISRVPGIEFESLTAESASAKPFISSVSATFSFDANITLTVDARGSYIPVHVSDFSLDVQDLNTGVSIATGSSSGTFPGKSLTQFTIPITFFGDFRNSSDATFADIANDCAYIYPTTTRNSMTLLIKATMKVAGLVRSYAASTQASDIVCPVQFPGNSA